MKKITYLLIVAVMLTLCACGAPQAVEPTAQPTPEVTPEPTPEPTPQATPEPSWEPAIIRAGNAEAFWTSYNRGDRVEVLGEWEYYYLIDGGEAPLFIDSRYVRLDSDAAFEETEGYAQSGTLVFSSPVFGDENEAVAELAMNTKLRVLDGKDDWRLVEWEGGTGYISAESISPNYISYSWSGGNNGGNSGNQGADGGDITLGFLTGERPQVQLLTAYSEPTYTQTGAATVLCDGTEAYLSVYSRGEEVKLVEIKGDECTLLVGQLLVNLPKWNLDMEEDAAYSPWTAYAESDAVVYKERQFRTEICVLNRNDEVQIVDELAELGVYIVSVNGETGYMSHDSVSETVIYDSYVPSGGGGGASPEWTAPVL